MLPACGDVMDAVCQSVSCISGHEKEDTSSDTIAPDIMITSPVNLAVVTLPVSVTVDATDDRAVDRVEYLINDDAFSISTNPPFSLTIDKGDLNDGLYKIQAVAYDTSENSWTAISAINIVTAESADPTLDIVTMEQSLDLYTIAIRATHDSGIARVVFEIFATNNPIDPASRQFNDFVSQSVDVDPDLYEIVINVCTDLQDPVTGHGLRITVDANNDASVVVTQDINVVRTDCPA